MAYPEWELTAEGIVPVNDEARAIAAAHPQHFELEMSAAALLHEHNPNLYPTP